MHRPRTDAPFFSARPTERDTSGPAIAMKSEPDGRSVTQGTWDCMDAFVKKGTTCFSNFVLFFNLEFSYFIVQRVYKLVIAFVCFIQCYLASNGVKTALISLKLLD